MKMHSGRSLCAQQPKKIIPHSALLPPLVASQDPPEGRDVIGLEVSSLGRARTSNLGFGLFRAWSGSGFFRRLGHQSKLSDGLMKGLKT